MAEKWELKTPDFEGISPAQVVAELGRSGFRITERALESWRDKGWLPPLERVEPLPGKKDARFVWRDKDVVLRVITLLAAKQVRDRMDSAVVMAWLAGFDYPITPIRELWAHFEELGWRKALRHAAAGGPISIADAVDVLVGEAYATRQGRRRSRHFVDALIRLDIDPDFDPESDLTLQQAEQIRRDLGQLNPQATALMAALRPEHVRGIASLIQDYYSAPRLAALIRSLSDDELSAAHRDVSFVLGLYRGWLREALRDTETDLVAFWVWPRVVWNLGRFLMLLDIAARRAGLGAVLDATIEFLDSVASDSDVRQLLIRCRWEWEELLTLTGDPQRAGEEFQSRVKNDPDFNRLAEIGEWVFSRLDELWRPIVTDAFARAKGVFESDNAITAATPVALDTGRGW